MLYQVWFVRPLKLPLNNENGKSFAFFKKNHFLRILVDVVEGRVGRANHGRKGFAWMKEQGIQAMHHAAWSCQRHQA
jgi:hypothetical protein